MLETIFVYEVHHVVGEGWYWRWVSDVDDGPGDGPYPCRERAEQMAESVISEARYGW